MGNSVKLKVTNPTNKQTREAKDEEEATGARTRTPIAPDDNERPTVYN